MLRKSLRYLLASLLILPCAAFAQMSLVTASKLQDLGGGALNGQACFTPANSNGSPIGFTFGGGGQGTTQLKCFPVSGGVLSASVADTSLTSPAHICYRMQLFSVQSRQTPVRTYSCLQPTGSPWSLDSYTDTSIVLPAGSSCSGASPFMIGVDGSSNIICGGIGLLSTTNITTALGYTPLNKAGDTMSGTLALSGDPSVNLQAATKQYVDRSTRIPITRFNPVGDCATDDTPAVQAAISAASSSVAAACGTNTQSPTQACSATVLVPHNFCSAITNITLPSYVSIVGEDRFTSMLIEKAGGNSHMITVAGNTTIRTAIRNLTLNGNASNQTGGPWDCIHYSQTGLVGGAGSPRHVIESNNIENCSGNGVYLSGDAGSDRIERNFIHNNIAGDGIYFHAPDSHIKDNELYLNGAYGLEGRVGADESANNKAWGNTLSGLWFTGSQWRSVSDEGQQNSQHGLYLNSCDRCMVTSYQGEGNGPGGTYGGIATYNATNSFIQGVMSGQDGTGGSVQPYALVAFGGSGNANNTYIIRSISPGVTDYYAAPASNETLILNGENVSDQSLDVQLPSTSSASYASPGVGWYEHYYNGTAAVSDSWRVFASPNSLTGTSTQSQFVFKYGGVLASVIAFAQSLAATASNNYNSPALQLNAACWNGSASQSTVWNWQVVEGSGASPTDTYTLTNSGTCAATPRVTIPYSTTVGGIFNMSTNSVNLINGNTLNFYSDAFSTLKAKIAASSGLGQFTQLQVTTSGMLITQLITLSTASISPTAVTASTCSDQSFTLTGATASSRFWSVAPPSALGNVSVMAINNGANSITLHFCNASTASVTPPAGVYVIPVVN